MLYLAQGLRAAEVQLVVEDGEWTPACQHAAYSAVGKMECEPEQVLKTSKTDLAQSSHARALRIFLKQLGDQNARYVPHLHRKFIPSMIDWTFTVFTSF